MKEGPQAGSWDTNDLWGGHGGRVYTTALATLTLEVYYRFLPLYAEVAPERGSGEVGLSSLSRQFPEFPRYNWRAEFALLQ